MDFTDAQLETLLAIIDLGTFDAAARRLHVTPSAVSQRVRSLEAEVGGVVVRRSSPCEATTIGSVLVRLARQRRLLRDEAVVELRGDPDLVLDIPIALNADSLATWWREVISEVATWPGVVLSLHLEDQAHSAELLRRGDVLAAVTADPEAVQGCSVESLGAITYLPVASPRLLERHPNRHWTQLPMIVFNEKDTLQHVVLDRAGAHAPAAAHRVPTSVDFVEAMVRGLGWGVAPLEQAKDALARGELVVLDEKFAVEVPLYWQRWRIDSPVMKRLSDVVRQCSPIGSPHGV